LVADTTRPKSS